MLSISNNCSENQSLRASNFLTNSLVTRIHSLRESNTILDSKVSRSPESILLCYLLLNSPLDMYCLSCLPSHVPEFLPSFGQLGLVRFQFSCSSQKCSSRLDIIFKLKNIPGLLLCLGGLVHSRIPSQCWQLYIVLEFTLLPNSSP